MAGGVREREAGPVRSSVLQPGPAVCPVSRRASGHGVAEVTYTVAYELSLAARLMVIETP